jgi:hypothetical protein
MQFQAKELSMAVPLGRLGAGQFFTPQRVSHLGYFLMFFFIVFWQSMSSMSVGSYNIVSTQSNGSKPGNPAGGSARLKNYSRLLWQDWFATAPAVEARYVKGLQTEEDAGAGEAGRSQTICRCSVQAGPLPHCIIVMPARLGQLHTFSQRSGFWLAS